MKQRGKRRNSFWCLAWYVAPKVSLKTNLAMNQCYITGVLVAAAWTHKGWHERRRRRVCSLPLGECFSVLLSSPKHTQLWWWADGCLGWCMPLLISCCQRWQEVIWWCSPIEKSSEPLTDSDISQRRMLSGSFGRINTSRKIWLYNNVDEIFCSSGHCFYWL